MGFSRQEYSSGVPFPSPGDLPDPGIKPRSLSLQADALPSEPPGKPIKRKTMSKAGLIRGAKDTGWVERAFQTKENLCKDPPKVNAGGRLGRVLEKDMEG